MYERAGVISISATFLYLAGYGFGTTASACLPERPTVTLPQKNLSLPPLPTRILAIATYKTKGKEHTLTLWDVPLPDGSFNPNSPETKIQSPGGFSHYRILSLYLVDTVGNQKNGKLLMLTYWRQQPFSNMVANLFTAPDGQTYVTAGYGHDSSELQWQVYAVDTKRDRGNTPIKWDPVDVKGWPGEDRALGFVNIDTGLVCITGMRTDADENGYLRLHVIVNDHEPDSADHTPDREPPTYWRVDPRQNKWTVVTKDGKETNLESYTGGYAIIRYYEDRPVQPKPAKGAVKK